MKLLQTGLAIDSQIARDMLGNASAEEADARTLREQAEGLMA